MQGCIAPASPGLYWTRRNLKIRGPAYTPGGRSGRPPWTSARSRMRSAGWIFSSYQGVLRLYSFHLHAVGHAFHGHVVGVEGAAVDGDLGVLACAHRHD